MKRTKLYSIALTLILGASFTFANASIDTKKELTHEDIVSMFHKKGVEIKFTNNVSYTGTFSACGQTFTLTAPSASAYNAGANQMIAKACGIQ